MSKISMVSSEALKILKIQLCEEKVKKVSLFISKFLTMQDMKSFWKIPHNVGFIHVKTNIVRNYLPSLNQIIIGKNVKDLKGVIRSFKDFQNLTLWGIFEKRSHFSFQNSSQCRIGKVFEKFLSMLEHFYWHHLQHFFNCWRWCQMKNSSQCWIFTRRNWKVFEKFLTMLDSSS